MVVEDQESSGFQQSIMFEPTLSATGHRIGWIALAPNGIQHILMDDKDLTLGSTNGPAAASKRLQCLNFSPNLAHFAYLEGQSLVLDGTALPGVLPGTGYVFSPDGNHLGYPASIENQNCFVVDGKIIAKNAFGVNFAFFSPDNQHIIFISQGSVPGSRDNRKVFVDGKMVTHYNEIGGALSAVFEFGPDGALMFASLTDDNFRRFHISMPAGTLSALLAASPAAK